MLPIFNLLYPLSEKYSSSLAIGFGLDDISLFFPVEFFSELAVLRRQQPCFGEKVIMRWNSLKHIHQAQPQQVFPRKNMNSRIMANLLEELQPYQKVRLNVVVGPQYIPRRWRFHAVYYFPSEFIRHFFDDIIVRY